MEEELLSKRFRIWFCGRVLELFFSLFLTEKWYRIWLIIRETIQCGMESPSPQARECMLRVPSLWGMMLKVAGSRGLVKKKIAPPYHAIIQTKPLTIPSETSQF